LVVAHWVADFVMQTPKMAAGKSKAWEPLLAHTATYAALMTVAAQFAYLTRLSGGYWFDFDLIFAFGAITFVTHTATDYVTSRMSRKRWEAVEALKAQEFQYSAADDGKQYFADMAAQQEQVGQAIHDFFVVIGADQAIHMATLALTWRWVFGGL
jgi:cation transport ATPase